MSESHILFPGRHHALTKFQAEYLRSALSGETSDLTGRSVSLTPGASVVFAVTSSDHGNTRRNPIPAHRREAMIERFSLAEGIPSETYLIGDVPHTDRFASYMLQAIEAAEGPELTPDNTVVACSTPSVWKLFSDLGFRVITVEAEGGELRPWDLIELIAAGESPSELHPVCRELYDRYSLNERIIALHSDPLASSEGELTETRDYKTYGDDFDSGAARKWEILAPHSRSGRVVDLGCGVGSLIKEISEDPYHVESDLYGIELARPLYEECEHRRSQGAFSNPNTFFYQRNLLAGELFRPGSIDTTLTVSLTHELYSYAGIEELRRGIRKIRAQTSADGVWLNLDVLGPEDPERIVWLELERGDAGITALRDGIERPPASGSKTLDSLSVAELFLQFAHDWRQSDGDPEAAPASERVRLIEGAFNARRAVFQTRLGIAMEFLTKKDYTDNWLSEMRESFCYWSWSDWEREITDAGFILAPGSGPLRNEWIETHRLDPVARLTPPGELDDPIRWPETSLLAVARPA